MNATETKAAKTAINNLVDTIGAWSNDKGFRDDFLAADSFDTLVPDLADALRNNVILAKIALIDTETSEAVESIRKTGYEGHIAGEGNFGEELADAVIRIFDLADMTGVNLGEEILSKMAANDKRAHKHGKKL